MYTCVNTKISMFTVVYSIQDHIMGDSSSLCFFAELNLFLTVLETKTLTMLGHACFWVSGEETLIVCKDSCGLEVIRYVEEQKFLL